MTTVGGRPSRAAKPRMPIDTRDLLTAVAQLGSTWPSRFGHHEIVDVSEALDRELLAGTLIDAITLSPQGRRLLDAPGSSATQA